MGVPKMTGEKILVVEDEYEIGEIIASYLGQSGFQVVVAEDGEQALRLFKQERPDLVILDVILPDMNGITWCREIREESNIPIIFLSCKQEADDIIAGLQVGGDDYMTKPFNPSILVAQVQAKLRRKSTDHQAGGSESRTLRHKNIQVDLQTYETCVDGHHVPLLAKEVQLLIFFMQHPNWVFSVEELLEQIWGRESESGEATVVVHISNLRKKIESNSAMPEHIVTIRGLGYKFSG
jgi:DNA-binding response OmpR family regulator